MGYDFPTNPPNGTTQTMPDGSIRVWDGTKWRAAPSADPGGTYLPLAGGTMTGNIVLPDGGNAISRTGGDGRYLQLTGGTMTGPLLLTATGTTAARSEQDRAAVVLNVKDFGALGTGTDDTSAFQAAIAAVPAAGGVVYAPQGTYVISSPLLLKANTWLRGDGMQVTNLKMGANANLNPMIGNARNGDSFITLTDFSLDGNKANNGAGTSQGIVLTQISQITARSIEVQNVNGYGFVTSGNGVNTTRGAHFSRIYVHNCDLTGFEVTYAFRQATIDGLRCSANGSVGNPTFPAVFLDASECLADNIIADSNISNGIHIHNVFGCTFSNLVATRNGMHGIFVETLVHSLGANWRAQSNGTTTSNTYDDIHFANTNVTGAGYGITANCEVSGIVVGPNTNFGSAQERYGLYVEDTVNVNVRLNDISYVAPGVTGNVRVPAAIGTLVVDDALVKPNVGGMFTATGPGTVSGAGVLTLFSGAGVGSRTVPANSAKVGTRYRLKAIGYYTTPAAASNLTIGVAFGGVAVASATVAATQSITSGYFEAEAEITVRAVGSGGLVVAEGRATLYTGAGTVQIATWATNAGQVAVNLSVDAILDLTASWATPTTHTITTQQSYAEAIGAGG